MNEQRLVEPRAAQQASPQRLSPMTLARRQMDRSRAQRGERIFQRSRASLGRQGKSIKLQRGGGEKKKPIEENKTANLTANRAAMRRSAGVGPPEKGCSAPGPGLSWGCATAFAFFCIIASGLSFAAASLVAPLSAAPHPLRPPPPRSSLRPRILPFVVSLAPPAPRPLLSSAALRLGLSLDSAPSLPLGSPSWAATMFCPPPTPSRQLPASLLVCARGPMIPSGRLLGRSRAYRL